MQVNQLMSREVRIAAPNQSLREAAQLMAELDSGVLPIGENDRLVGMITDRDITVRGVAKGKNPDTPIRDVMSSEVKYCFEDQDIDEVTENMAELQVRRLPVVDRNKRLVGIISLGDIATGSGTQDEAGEALTGVSRHNASGLKQSNAGKRLS